MENSRRGVYEIRSTGVWELDLLAAIVRRAVQDATRGNHHAARWLDDFYPGWRTVTKLDGSAETSA